MAPPPAPPAKREENSGLHEIRELARSTKRRISSQHASVAEDALLRTTGSLDAIALPDPAKESATEIHIPLPEASPSAPAATVQTVATAVPAAVLSDRPIPGTPPRKSGLAVFLMFVVVCAGAGVGLYLWKGQSSGDSAVPEAAAKAVPASAGATAEPADEMAPTAVAPEEEPAAEEPADSEGSEAELAVSDDDASEPAGDRREESDQDREARASSDERDGRKGRDEKVARSKDDDERDDEDDEPARGSKKASSDDAMAKAIGSSSKKASAADGASLDDVLSSVTGGIDEAPVEKEEKTAPTRERLDRSDVARAMGEVQGLAKSCHSAEQFTGTVTVKFTVAPSGKIAKASATGEHKSSPTGKCVLKAVNAATFPAFNGRPTTFSFPFLLAP